MAQQRPPYERLSFLDASFLALETRTTHMHVAGVMIFETGRLVGPDGSVDIDRLRRYIESRLDMIPRYRQTLAYIPVERAPVWVDDEHFNIGYHVRHTALPQPGSPDQLKRLVGRICSQQLDRRKPLWELWVVEGLEDDRIVLVSKVHHSMIDGVAGVDLMAVLLEWEPNTDFTEAEPFEPIPPPSGTELLVRDTARKIGEMVSTLANVRRLPGRTLDVFQSWTERAAAVASSLGSGWLASVSETPINGEIGPNRRFDFVPIPLDGVKTIKNALGGTVNDAVLAIVAGAIRRFLMEVRGFDVSGIDFKAMAPVSVRSDDQQGKLGNQVAMWLVALPVDEPDPVARYRVVARHTDELKATNQALGAATLVQLSSGAPMTLVSLASRVAARTRPFNLTVTNVPGPQFPLYLLGSRMEATVPMVPLWDTHGVGVAIFSYDGSLWFGFNADWDIMGDLDRFVQSVEEEFAELSRAAAEFAGARKDGDPANAPVRSRGADASGNGPVEGEIASKVVAAFEGPGEILEVAEIAAAAGITRSQASSAASRLVENDVLERVGRGRYRITR